MVGGEASILTDGKLVHSWDTTLLIWRAAGDTTRPEDIRVIPAWLRMAIALVTEWTFKIGTPGRRQPLIFNKRIMSHVYQTQTFNIDKTRERLGNHPVPDWKDGIKRSVEWEIEIRKSDGKSV